MKILKKYSTATVLAAVICAAALLFGVHRSVGGQLEKLEASFYTGVVSESSGYVLPSIGQQLSDRSTAALGLVTIAGEMPGMEEMTAALRAAREELLNADGIYDKYAANKKLQTAYEEIVSALESAGVDENRMAAFESYCQTMDGAQRLIQNSEYNRAVSEFEREILGSFPVNILKYPAFVGEPEYFGAEG